MSEPFETVARAVIKRIASTNPGHQEITADDIQTEFDSVFFDTPKDNKARMTSTVLETIDKLVPERAMEALYSSGSGERLCLEVFPVIWPHTADEV